MKKKKIVCISGMERSGTSMVARIVNLLGVYFGGQDKLIMETKYNLKGCWENKTLLKISDDILARFGGDTHNIPDFPEGWINDEGIADLEEQARKIIDKEFSKHDVWGWKDTRCSLLMPFWQKLLPDMEYVICIRNPCDVAHSVVTRKWTASYTEAYSLWYMYTSSIIRYTAGKRRIFVFYEDFMGKNSMSAVRRLAEFLGPESVKMINNASSDIEAFITKGLQHHETPILDILQKADLPLSIKEYYLILLLLGKGSVKSLSGADATEVIDALSFLKDKESATITKLALTERKLEKNEHRMQALLDSGSWRITAPLRKAVDVIKKPK